MKRILTAALLCFAFSQMDAQVTFRPGVRAGVNFSHFTEGDNYDNGSVYDPQTQQYYRNRPAEFNSKTDFYVGLYGALKLSKFYTLQPELNYSRQGSKVEWAQYNTNTHSYIQNDTQIDVSYISIGLINKFTFADKFNLHIGPTVDVIVDKNRNRYYYDDVNIDPALGYNYYYDDYYDTESDIDLAFVLGVGYNFTKNLGIEARVKKGIIPVFDFWDNNHTNVVFSAGLNYTFDIK
ncbi:outer membrane beta-barrel protein [Flavobacterium sp.]|uniref:outer membrane beta-barrel protein n=1 Tax=Flavobacterium sp. TaxID=239 RepID=UPI0039E3B432